MSQGGVALRGCYVPGTRSLSFATCGGVEAGVARGRGGTESFTRVADDVMTAYLERFGDLAELELRRFGE